MVHYRVIIINFKQTGACQVERGWAMDKAQYSDEVLNIWEDGFKERLRKV